MPNNPARPVGEIFREIILAWSRADRLTPVIAALPRSATDGVKVRPLESALLSSKKKPRFSLSETEWPELGLHSYVYPCFLFVLEGEADIRIGVEGKEKGRRKSSAAPTPEVWVYELPARSCLIVPAGVPYSDGKLPHWERGDVDQARSRILWLQVLPTGAIIHICRTVGSSHTHSSAFFIKDAHLWLLTQFLLERGATSRTGAPRGDALLRSYLNTLLLCVDQNWDAGQILESDEVRRALVTSEQRGAVPGEAGETGDSHAAALERACRYIQSHLTDPVTPEQIARHAFVSVPQLKRLFRARLDTPVMKYVTALRIEEAKALLLATGLNIDHVGVICGYPHRTHFSRVFKAHCGVSPQAFRRQHLTASED